MAKGTKGDLVMLVDPITKATSYISPSNVIVYVGTVKEENGIKKVELGTPILLGVFLSEKENEIRETKKELRETKKELSDLKINYKKNMKILIGVINVLVAQTEINSLDLNELLDMEDN